MRVQNAVFLMVLYCLTLSSLGQETDKVKKEINLKMGLFNYFNENYPSLNLGAEFFFSKPFSMYAEYGRIYQPRDREEVLQSGSKKNLEFRFFPVNDSDEKLFLGLRLHHRRAVIAGRYTLGYECDPFSFRQCTYYSNFNGDVQTDFFAYQLIVGSQMKLFDRFYSEAYVGFGESNHRVDRSSVNNGDLVENGRLYDESDFGQNVLFTMRFNLVYYLRYND
ncbi:MAG: hypothetical protein HRT61_23095 [Ekhidna sp.]|nr:hypothetical protein [Ekhidna sp.]